MARADHRKGAEELRVAVLNGLPGLFGLASMNVIDDLERCADELEEAANRAARLLADKP